jgi:hypothetical protein
MYPECLVKGEEEVDRKLEMTVLVEILTAVGG